MFFALYKPFYKWFLRCHSDILSFLYVTTELQNALQLWSGHQYLFSSISYLKTLPNRLSVHLPLEYIFNYISIFEDTIYYMHFRFEDFYFWFLLTVEWRMKFMQCDFIKVEWKMLKLAIFQCMLSYVAVLLASRQHRRLLVTYLVCLLGQYTLASEQGPHLSLQSLLPGPILKVLEALFHHWPN